LVGVPWSIGNFPSTSAQWTFGDGVTSVQVTGAVDYLVPEPSVAAMVAFAAFALLAAMRKRVSPGT